MTKAEIRKKYLEKRRALTDEAYETVSDQLSQGFFNANDLQSIRLLHIYLPIRRLLEPDTNRIIAKVRTEFPLIQIVIPFVNYTTSTLDNYLLADQEIVENKWGIPEPIGGTKIMPQNLDMVVVPLLAFDEAGHRIGYGKGFYDKLLVTCREDCKKVGLSPFPPLVSIADTGEHDRKLDLVITPTRIYSFS